jgi:hypothetical protein
MEHGLQVAFVTTHGSVPHTPIYEVRLCPVHPAVASVAPCSPSPAYITDKTAAACPEGTTHLDVRLASPSDKGAECGKQDLTRSFEKERGTKRRVVNVGSSTAEKVPGILRV